MQKFEHGQKVLVSAGEQWEERVYIAPHPNLHDTHVYANEQSCYMIKGRFIKPIPVKKEGWTNLYVSRDGIRYLGTVYSTKEEAINAVTVGKRADTIRIEWEE